MRRLYQDKSKIDMGKITSESELSENPIFAEEIPAFARPKNIAAFGNSCRATSVSICEDLWLRNLGDWNLGESFCHESHSGIFSSRLSNQNPRSKKKLSLRHQRQILPKRRLNRWLRKNMMTNRHDQLRLPQQFLFSSRQFWPTNRRTRLGPRIGYHALK